MKDLDAFIQKLLNDLIALPEEKMRSGLLGRKFSEITPEEIARIIDLLYKKGAQGRLAREAQVILVDPAGLKAALGEEKYREVYLCSIELGLRKVSRLFSELPPHRKGLSGYDKEEEARMEFISLGQRRAMSRSHEKDTIDRLLSDPDPTVIGNLLNNPRTTLKEVLKIASKRPNSVEILRLLTAHRVWSRRYEVKKAIVLNPYTPPRIAIGLLGFLLIQDLKAASADKSIHPEVRLSAKDLFEEKKVR